MSSNPHLKIHVEFGDNKADFEGSASEVMKALMNYITEIYPAYELVKGLMLTVDLERLMRDVEGVIAFTEEGVVVATPRDKLLKLNIKDLISLHLVKAYLGHIAGKLAKNTLTVDELLTSIGGKIGTLTGGLSVMVDEGLVARVGRGEYKITTIGITRFQEDALPKIKREIKGEG
ncbi:MAG: hypothetical protein QXJ75_00220 [Candidatus Bathyarchaeia archaeon]